MNDGLAQHSSFGQPIVGAAVTRRTSTEPMAGAAWCAMRRPVRWIVALAMSALQVGCGAQAMDMNVVVFNYWPRAMGDVYVDGQHVGAGFGTAVVGL